MRGSIAPWPFADRDYAIAPAEDREGDGSLVLWWESASQRLGAGRKGVVRVTEVRGGVRFRPGESPGTTRATYSDVAVLGGRLPRWAVEESYRRGPVGSSAA